MNLKRINFYVAETISALRGILQPKTRGVAEGRIIFMYTDPVSGENEYREVALARKATEEGSWEYVDETFNTVTGRNGFKDSNTPESIPLGDVDHTSLPAEYDSILHALEEAGLVELSANSPIVYNSSTQTISHVDSSGVRHVTDAQIDYWDNKVEDDDARLSDDRTPLVHGNEAHSEDYVTDPSKGANNAINSADGSGGWKDSGLKVISEGIAPIDRLEPRVDPDSTPERFRNLHVNSDKVSTAAGEESLPTLSFRNASNKGLRLESGRSDSTLYTDKASLNVESGVGATLNRSGEFIGIVADGETQAKPFSTKAIQHPDATEDYQSATKGQVDTALAEKVDDDDKRVITRTSANPPSTDFNDWWDNNNFPSYRNHITVSSEDYGGRLPYPYGILLIDSDSAFGRGSAKFVTNTSGRVQWVTNWDNNNNQWNGWERLAYRDYVDARTPQITEDTTYTVHHDGSADFTGLGDAFAFLNKLTGTYNNPRITLDCLEGHTEPLRINISHYGTGRVIITGKIITSGDDNAIRIGVSYSSTIIWNCEIEYTGTLTNTTALFYTGGGFMSGTDFNISGDSTGFQYGVRLRSFNGSHTVRGSITTSEYDIYLDPDGAGKFRGIVDATEMTTQPTSNISLDTWTINGVVVYSGGLTI